MKKILVTGGAGYIGSHTCKVLHENGYLPVVYDNLVYGHEWAVKWGPFEHGDTNDRQRLDEVIQKHKPSAVMHFAAYAYVGESVENPGKYYQNNVSGTVTLLEAMRDNGIGKFVFSSTCATYGEPQTIPISESHPQLPINPYGASKLMIERILQDFDVAHQLRSISLRYFNAAGADPDAEIGEDHHPETHLIPLVLDVAAGTREHITVYGDDYDTPDGTCVRDYIHVTDLASAHLLALNALEEGAMTTAYNLGNGKGFSVKEVINVAQSIAGHDISVEIGPRRAGDPPSLVGNAELIQNELDWSPGFTSLNSILKTAWAWQKRQKKVSQFSSECKAVSGKNDQKK